VQRTGWTSDPASRALSLQVHAGSWTGGEEPRPRRLKGSGGAGAAQATWTSTPCRGAGRRRATRIDATVQDGRDSAVGEETGSCRSLSSRGEGAAQVAYAVTREGSLATHAGVDRGGSPVSQPNPCRELTFSAEATYLHLLQIQKRQNAE